eukprot:689329-Amphidinium_carterae.2
MSSGMGPMPKSAISRAGNWNPNRSEESRRRLLSRCMKTCEAASHLNEFLRCQEHNKDQRMTLVLLSSLHSKALNVAQSPPHILLSRFLRDFQAIRHLCGTQPCHIL